MHSQKIFSIFSRFQDRQKYFRPILLSVHDFKWKLLAFYPCFSKMSLLIQFELNLENFSKCLLITKCCKKFY